MFLTFKSQEERQQYGGSAFIELQYCCLPAGTDIRQLVSVDQIHNWKDNSLYIYIDDDNTFIDQYGDIFVGGTYNNLQTGYLDLCGINYYSPILVKQIIEAIENQRPTDCKKILPWLYKAWEYNGIYVLGL